MKASPQFFLHFGGILKSCKHWWDFYWIFSLQLKFLQHKFPRVLVNANKRQTNSCWPFRSICLITTFHHKIKYNWIALHCCTCWGGVVLSSGALWTTSPWSWTNTQRDSPTCDSGLKSRTRAWEGLERLRARDGGREVLPCGNARIPQAWHVTFCGRHDTSHVSQRRPRDGMGITKK